MTSKWHEIGLAEYTLLHRQIHNHMSLLPECLPDPLKKFPLSRILLGVT